MTSSHYLKSDGNGGVNISKSMLALLGTLILFFTLVANIVAYGVGIDKDVEDLKTHSDRLLLKVEEHDVGLEGMDVKISNIEEDISEIKQDLKEFIKYNGG